MYLGGSGRANHHGNIFVTGPFDGRSELRDIPKGMVPKLVQLNVVAA